jgi:hypothetical protein
LNNFLKFSLTAVATSSTDIFFTLAIAAIPLGIVDESFRTPLSGLKNGASVSVSILSNGIAFDNT